MFMNNMNNWRERVFTVAATGIEYDRPVVRVLNGDELIYASSFNLYTRQYDGALVVKCRIKNQAAVLSDFMLSFVCRDGHGKTCFFEADVVVGSLRGVLYFGSLCYDRNKCCMMLDVFKGRALPVYLFSDLEYRGNLIESPDILETLAEEMARGRGAAQPNQASAPTPPLQAPDAKDVSDRPGAAEACPDKQEDVCYDLDALTGDALVSRGLDVENVTIYADGACLPTNPGSAAGAFRIMSGDFSFSGCRMIPGIGTNNIAELMAIISALRLLPSSGCRVRVFSDSQYVIHALTKGWLANWQQKDWKTVGGDPVKNRALWEELSRLSAGHTVSWNWVRGHADDVHNNFCDRIANAAAKKQYEENTAAYSG